MASLKKISKTEKQIIEILDKLDTDTEKMWEIENNKQNYQIKLNINSKKSTKK